MSNPNSTDKPEAKPALSGFTGSASWSKAEMHFGIAKAAWKLAARNEHGAAMVIEHMERAIETLKAMTPNVRPSCLELERHKCINDVCCYCAGHCPPYHRTPQGPNDAGNWVHLGKSGQVGVSQREEVLCKASSIFARARFETEMRKQANSVSNLLK